MYHVFWDHAHDPAAMTRESWTVWENASHPEMSVLDKRLRRWSRTAPASGQRVADQDQRISCPWLGFITSHSQSRILSISRPQLLRSVRAWALVLGMEIVAYGQACPGQGEKAKVHVVVDRHADLAHNSHSADASVLHASQCVSLYA